MKDFSAGMGFDMTIWLWILHVVIYEMSPCDSLHTSSCSFNSMCLCSSDQHDLGARYITDISCISVPLVKFPNLPEGNIKQLEVMGSRIPALESESLAGCQVHSLSLPNNHLQHVAERAFSSTSKSLKSLDLSYNELDAVPFQALKELRSLQWINLHGNRIQLIRGDWSHSRNTIINLFLGENDITEIPSDSELSTWKARQGLHQFKSLIWLNLDGNRIAEIHPHSLPSTLQTLSLSHNLIKEFPDETAHSLPQLQWLYLRGNHIRFIPWYSTGKKIWLVKIDLRENYLSELVARPFNNSVSVRDLNLAFNSIRNVVNESFNGLSCGRIIISYNSVEKVESSAFKGVEDTLEFLDFDHNNLMEIPLALKQLKALKYLYLSSNFLAEINQKSLEEFCSNLKALSFSGNRLSRIPTEALQNCTRISHFNGAYNKIYELAEGDFTNWASGVRNLILANNRIATLAEQIFAGLEELKELSLSFNPIRYIDERAFDGLNKLETLELSFALEGQTISPNVFKATPNLQWLSVDNNDLQIMRSDLFDYLPNLKYINCESNRLKFIPNDLFKRMHTKLKEVRFSNNEIKILHTGTFDTLPNLESVVLSYNKIVEIQGDAFANLPALKTVILSNNLVQKIDQAFTNLQNLQRIDLHSNQLSELSFNMFANTSYPLKLNLSYNSISSCHPDNKILNIDFLDLAHNNLDSVPNCIENTALLKRLLLDFNEIQILNHNAFMHLTSLETLSLKENAIRNIHRYAFFGLQNLQILDLSRNMISLIHLNQFSMTPKLRILNLSSNNLNYLPREVFSNTMLEKLDINYNFFSVVPNVADVGRTLRHLSISSNNIEHIGSTTFSDIPHLHALDLSNNKFNMLPDNVFTGLGLLQKLNLKSNPIRANFKELFHYAQNLKELVLAKSGITATPTLPLPNLISLNLSYNHIEHLGKNTVQNLEKLRLLDLSHNSIGHIPGKMWAYLPMLKNLDLSNNPIKQIQADSFQQLKNLQILNIQGMHKLERFEGKAIEDIKILHTLSIETWPKIDNFKAQFCKMLRKLETLRILKLRVQEHILNDQLSCISNRKIRQLEITGNDLRVVERNAFNKFTRNPDLVLKISNTEIEDLPPGLFSNMYKISYLSIDLRYNMLSFLNTDIFYGNSTTWKDVGTTLVSGGLRISDNPFKCGCHLAWLGYWLRRWMRESLQSHSAPIESAVRMNEALMEATCVDVTTGIKVPIVQMLPEDTSCHASALSTAPSSNKISVISILLSCIFFNVIYS